jgi:hypothetical protein
LLVIEIFFTFFNTALSQSSIFAQYPKKNMIKFSQQPGTKQQKIVFPAHDLNLEGSKIKSTLDYKISSDTYLETFQLFVFIQNTLKIIIFHFRADAF